MVKKIGIAVALLVVVLGAVPAQAVPVGLELALLVDTSGSISATEYNLQKSGYVQAFQSAAVQNAILNSAGGAIAVTYVEWSGNNQQAQRVGWTLIDSAASANAFAAAIAAVTRIYSGSTAVQDALIFGSGLFANGFESQRQVMDVSGDGADNATLVAGGCDRFLNPGCGRDLALGAGVDAINGLPILGEAGLLLYYQTYVQGGTNSFTNSVTGFDSFSTAIQEKLVREITNPIPEPGTLLLIGSGLLGLFARRRRA